MSLQKRLRKKKIVAQTPGKTHDRITNKRAGTETDVNQIDDANASTSSIRTHVGGKEQSGPDQQQHENHEDGDACNCFLRRGQMFLPPTMLEANYDNA